MHPNPIKESLLLKWEFEFQTKEMFWWENVCSDTTFFTVGAIARMKDQIHKFLDIQEKSVRTSHGNGDVSSLKHTSKIFKDKLKELQRNAADFYLKKYFDEESKGIRQTLFTVPNVYSIFSFCGIVADFKGICDEIDIAEHKQYPLKDESIIKIININEDLFKQRKADFDFFVRKSFKDSGACAENYWTTEAPTSVITTTALKIFDFFSGLFEANELFVDRAMDYLKLCKSKTFRKDGLEFTGFCPTPSDVNDEQKVWVCPTFFVSKALFAKSYSKLKNISEKKNLKWSKEEMYRILNLVKLSWREVKVGDIEMGGFTVGPYFDIPNLVHVKHNLMLIYYIDKEIGLHNLRNLDKFLNTTRAGEKLLNFIKSCRCEDEDGRKYGYGFTTGFNPNVYAIRSVIDIYSILSEADSLQRSKWIYDLQSVYDFLVSHFYDEAGEGFVGFASFEKLNDMKPSMPKVDYRIWEKASGYCQG